MQGSPCRPHPSWRWFTFGLSNIRSSPDSDLLYMSFPHLTLGPGNTNLWLIPSTSWSQKNHSKPLSFSMVCHIVKFSQQLTETASIFFSPNIDSCLEIDFLHSPAQDSNEEHPTSSPKPSQLEHPLHPSDQRSWSYSVHYSSYISKMYEPGNAQRNNEKEKVSPVMPLSS